MDATGRRAAPWRRRNLVPASLDRMPLETVDLLSVVVRDFIVIRKPREDFMLGDVELSSIDINQ